MARVVKAPSGAKRIKRMFKEADNELCPVRVDVFVLIVSALINLFRLGSQTITSKVVNISTATSKSWKKVFTMFLLIPSSPLNTIENRATKVLYRHVIGED